MSTKPPLYDTVPPRCPHYENPADPEALLPYLDVVARRPYHQGLHASWDLQQGEHVLVRTDNWHDPVVIEAVKMILEKYGCTYEVMEIDRGPLREFDGHDEAEGMRELTAEIWESFDIWHRLEDEGRVDKCLWGFGGPVMSDARMKIQRMPFINPEYVVTEANLIPGEVLKAIDKWTWLNAAAAERVRIQDPEGTDISYTNWPDYYNDDRTLFAHEGIDRFFGRGGAYKRFRTYNPGHVWGRPVFYHPEKEDGNGVLAGTMNHWGPFPHMKMEVENSRITAIEGGGLFGDKLRGIKKRTDADQFPGHPGKGLLYWWEASIGTNPKIHRPRSNYLVGHGKAFFERMRSGVIHLGFGTVISSDLERDAHSAGLFAGHWHIHLYFPTVTLTMPGGEERLLIENGRLKALDDPGVRDVAEAHDLDPDVWFAENWIPAVPGINLEGDYFDNYADDPTGFTKSEIHLCRHNHELYMKMIARAGEQVDHSHH